MIPNPREREKAKLRLRLFGMEMVRIADLTLPQLEGLLASVGQPSYRARQVMRWVYRRGARTFAQMTDLPQGLRDKLESVAVVETLTPVSQLVSSDGNTRKVLFRLADGRSIETVLMLYDPMGQSRERRTVCVSTQVGCALGCIFCATGQQGFERDLTPGEIIEQVLYFAHRALVASSAGASMPGRPAITNVVFMGMGEPLANYNATWQAVEMLNSPQGLGLGARQMTLSTVGLVPGILRLSKERLQVGLAVSLHAPNDALRSRLLPINRRYPLQELLAACRDYQTATGRRLTFQYVLLEGLNDAPSHAVELAHLIQGMDAHINLIPSNPTVAQIKAPPMAKMLAFQRELRNRGVSATLRVERGLDIEAGCGQLRAKKESLVPHLLEH